MEAMVATNEMSPESSTIEMDSPSTPIRYSTLKALIQMKCCTSCTPVGVPVQHHGSGRRRGRTSARPAAAQASDPPLVTMAMTRAAWSSVGLGQAGQLQRTCGEEAR
jgi:hypothetical protein